MAGLKLKSLVPKVAPRKKIEWRLSNGIATYRETKGDVIFVTDMQYLTTNEMAVLQQDAVERRVVDAETATKERIHNNKIAVLAVCEEAVRGWSDLSVGDLRSVQMAADFSNVDVAQAVEFNAENLETLVIHSLFGGMMVQCLQDYSYWFPKNERADAEKDAEGNSESGPGTNTSSPARSAASASAPT